MYGRSNSLHEDNETDVEVRYISKQTRKKRQREEDDDENEKADGDYFDTA